jgi:hypothetical protein
MRYLNGSGIGLGLLALALLGCSHDPAMPSVQSVEASGFRQAVSGVQVVVDPLFGRERARTEFPGGEAFEEQGLLPVQVLIENGSRRPVRTAWISGWCVRGPERDCALPGRVRDGEAPVAGWAALPILGPSASAYRNSDWLKQFEARALRDIPAAGGSAVGWCISTFLRARRISPAPGSWWWSGASRGTSGISTSPAGAARDPGRPAPTASAGPNQPAQPSQTPTRVEGGRRRDHPQPGALIACPVRLGSLVPLVAKGPLKGVG